MSRKKKRVESLEEKEHALVMPPIEQIDYDRLADCIAKAVASENEKRAEKYSITREWMKFIIIPVLGTVSVVVGLLGIAFFIQAISSIVDLASPIWSFQSLLKLIIAFFFALICFAISLFTFFAAKELDKEKDRQFVVAVFSSMVSLGALVVALVALYMGVG